jgi:hypothetical protein
MIPSLNGSHTFRLAVEVYQRHHDAGTGACLACGHRAPCLPRRHAASVILAAGVDPRGYDASSRLPPGGGHHPPVSEVNDDTLPYEGFRLGGRPRPLSAEGYRYERDTE